MTSFGPARSAPGTATSALAKDEVRADDWRAILLTALIASLAWAAAHSIAFPNLDRYHDMLESFAWSQTFEWGSFKHPPFFAWVTGLWFSVFPRSDWFFKLLAYANVAVGLLGVAALARHMGQPLHARAAIVLLMCCLPYTTLAAKFNANSQLLSIWPWAACALIANLNAARSAASTVQAWAWSTALGLLCAAAMLAKYYSGVLLVSLFAVALLHSSARSWFASPHPWWALALTLFALTPHALWLRQSEFAMLGYALDQGGGAIDWRNVLAFLLIPFLYWMPRWLLCAAFFARKTEGTGSSRWALFVRNLGRAWRARGPGDYLFWLAVLPWLISLAFGITGVVALSVPWAIPLGFAFPLLWLRNLQDQAGARASEAAIRALTHAPAGLAVLGLVMLGASALAWHQAIRGTPEYYRPTENAARAILVDWEQRHPGLRLGWSGGEWPLNAMMGFYADPSIRALPGMPDSQEARLAPHPAWRSQGGVLICSADLTDACNRAAREWLIANRAEVSPRELRTRRHGWRFPAPGDWSYVIYDVLPSESSTGSSPQPAVTGGANR